MKLNRLFYIPVLAVAMTACSDVSEDDRYIDTGVFTPARAVLIEDFTGQNCVNCPAAHEIIEKLQEQYGDYIIPVSIHAGGFGISVDRGGLATTVGNEYNDHWGINSWPAGIVDRNSGITTYDQWAAIARTDMSRPATMELSIEASLNAGSESADVTVTVNPEVTAKATLQVWVIENGIVARQRSGNETIRDYVHNNVFRAPVNGTWGQEISYTATETDERTFTVDLESGWDPANLDIVAFVYDNSGVIVVNRAHIE